MRSGCWNWQPENRDHALCALQQVPIRVVSNGVRWVSGDFRRPEVVSGVASGGFRSPIVVSGGFAQPDVVSSSLGWLQVVSSGLGWFQVVAGGLRWSQLAWGGFSWFQVAWGGLRLFRTVGQGWFQVAWGYSGGFKWHGLVSNGFGWPWLVSSGCAVELLAPGIMLFSVWELIQIRLCVIFIFSHNS